MIRPISLMIDSGAFNSWSRGITLDIKKYIAFIKRNEHLIYSYVCMDTIPGFKGQARTLAQVQQSAKLSYENLQHMKGAGLRPIPVFHQSEAFEWLERMLDDGEDYIGFSRNMNKKSQWQQAGAWLDECFRRIKKHRNGAKVRTHGFGITHQKLLARYPWFSADSTAWVIQSSYGHVFIPTFRNGGMDFSLPQCLKVSIRESCSSYQPFGMLSQIERDHVAEYFKSIGTDLLSIIHNKNSRRIIANLQFFKGLENQLNIKIFQASNFRYNSLMNETNVRHRLFSYWDIMDCSTKKLEQYSEGKHEPPITRIAKVDWTKQSYLNTRYANFIERMKIEDCDATD